MHKKILFALLLLFVAPFAKGQDYVSMFAGADSVTWYITNCPEGCVTNVIVARPDTITGNLLQKDAYTALSYPDPTLTGHYREDTAGRKIYYRADAMWGDTTEFLLYDFSLAVGDSMNVTELTNGYQMTPIGWSKLDSIGVADTLPGNPRIFYLTHTDYTQQWNYSYPLRWIEGIGQTDFMQGGTWGQLHCFFRDTAHIYKTDMGYVLSTPWNPGPGVDSSCLLFVSSVANIKMVAAANVFPNPAGSSLNITLGQDDNVLQRVQLLNAYGATVSTQTATGITARIDLAGLPDGFYTAVITTKRGRSVQAFLKQD